MSSIRKKDWCFTWFDMEKEIPWKPEKMRYLVYQLEKCPTTERLHWQCFVQFKKEVSRETMKRELGHNGWCAFRLGTPEEARDYCKKVESRVDAENAGPHEFGILSKGQGSRSDLEQVGQLALSGTPIAEIAENAPGTFMRYHRGIAALRATRLQTRRTWKTEVWWFWGESGAGKTRKAFEMAEADGAFYLKDPDNKWWDLYEGEETIIIDDFKGFGGISISFMLRLLDRYPLTGEIKGGTVWLAPKKIYITSIHPPGKYLNLAEPRRQMERRIVHIEEIEVEQSWPPTPLAHEDAAGPSGESGDLFLNENFSFFNYDV